MDPLVSVIVPAYNAENTLQKTIGDILSQSFTDFEVVLVDDGSTDKTPALCDLYAAENDKVQVLHQKNGGLSNARNNGTKQARGRYVTYVDSDDRLDVHCLEYLVRAVSEIDADMAAGLFDRVRENENSFRTVGPLQARRLSQKEALEAMERGKMPVGACCKLVKREVYLQNPFWEGKYYEDLSNTYRILLQHESVALVYAPLYHYVMRGGSITGRKQTSYQQCLDYYEAIHSCWDGILSRYPDLEADACILRARDYISLYLSIKRCPRKSAELRKIAGDIKEWVKKYGKTVLKNPNAPLELRLRVMLFIVSPVLYQHLYYMGIRVKGKSIG